MNKDRFRGRQLARPTEYVPAPQLAGILFDEGEKPRLKVRGLDANELFLARQRRSENNPVIAMAKALQESGQLQGAMTEAFRGLFGDPKQATAAQTAYSTELIVMGTIDEDGKSILDYEDVARLGEHFPAVFLELSNVIQRLSGEASVVVGEPRGHSGKTIESGVPSTSVKPEGNSSSKPSPTSSPITGLPTLN